MPTSSNLSFPVPRVVAICSPIAVSDDASDSGHALLENDLAVSARNVQLVQLSHYYSEEV